MLGPRTACRPIQRDRPGSEAAELLAVIAAVLTFGDIFRDRELLVWVANVPALSAAVHGYSHAPAMASLSHSLHLLHLPGKANPAYIPSRVPFLCRNGSHVLDPDRLSPAHALMRVL